MESIPRDLRNLRACLLCGLVKSFDQFETDGCENCERYLNMKHDQDKIYECTSSNFDGMVGMMKPEDSWVAKWLKIRKTRGVYAVSVSGSLPDPILQPEDSWVAKWLKIRKTRGVYAVSVSGSLPDPILQELKELGVPARPNMRDMSVK